MGVPAYIAAYVATTALSRLFRRNRSRAADPRLGYQPRSASFGNVIPVAFGTCLLPAPAYVRGRLEVNGATWKQHQLVLGLCQGPVSAVQAIWLSDGSDDPTKSARVAWADAAACGMALQAGNLTGHTPTSPAFTRGDTADVSLLFNTVTNRGTVKIAAGSARSFLPTLDGATQVQLAVMGARAPDPNPEETVLFFAGTFNVYSISEKELVVDIPAPWDLDWDRINTYWGAGGEAPLTTPYWITSTTGAIYYPGISHLRADPLDLAQLYRPLAEGVKGAPGFSAEGSWLLSGYGPDSLSAEGVDVIAAIVGNDYWAANLGLTVDGDLGSDGTANSSARRYCDAAELFVSGYMDEQRSAAEHLQDVLDAIDCVALFSEDKLKILPLGDEAIVNGAVTYTPNTTPAYALSKFVVSGPDDPAVRMQVIPDVQAYNVINVEFRDRNAGGANYRVSIETAFDGADIERQAALYGGTGKREAPPLVLHWITSAEQARKIAQLRLQRVRAVRNAQTFRLGWQFARLEGMDLLTLTDARFGLSAYQVRVSAIEEDDDGTLSVETIDWPIGIAGSPAYAVQSSDPASPGVTADPGTADAAVVIPVPKYLSGDANEVWIAASGPANGYGGVDVYLSSDGTSYLNVGRITGRSVMGRLSTALASGSELDSVNSIDVSLAQALGELTGTNDAGRDRLETLCYVDGEILAFRDVTPHATEAYRYTLSSLRRGAYGSTIGAHAVGTRFVRLDENVLRVALPASWFGATVYVKLRPFNVYGSGQPALADVTATTTTPALPTVAAPTGATLAVSSTAPGTTANQWRQSALELLHARWARVQWSLTSAFVTGFDVVLYTGTDPDAAEARVAEALRIPANVRDAVLAASAGASPLTVRAAVRARYADGLVSSWATTSTGTIDANSNVAASALTLAGSKALVTYSASAPGSGAAGDLWFNTDTTTNCPDANCKGHTLDANGVPNVGSYPHRGTYWVHRWSGTAWVDGERQALIAAGEIAAGAIVADKIRANQIATSHLNFTPVQSTNVVASINATAEGIRIAGNRITVDGTVSFGSGYDPTGRIATGGAAADVNANVTTISGGKITANSITASQLAADAIKTSNFTSTGSGTSEVATAGAKMQADGTALLVAAGNLKVGPNLVSGMGTVRARGQFYVNLTSPYVYEVSGNVGIASVSRVLLGSPWSYYVARINLASGYRPVLAGAMAFVSLRISDISTSANRQYQAHVHSLLVANVGGTNYVDGIDVVFINSTTGDVQSPSDFTTSRYFDLVVVGDYASQA